MGTSIAILSSLPLPKIQRASELCLARVQALGLEAPAIEVLEEHPNIEGLLALLDDEDVELAAKIQENQCVVLLEKDTTLASDPTYVECLRFLFRRAGEEALVQFPEGIAEAEIGLALLASLNGIEEFDEREEARKVHARLSDIKYRILAKRWMDGGEHEALRSFSNHEMEAWERSNRLSFPADFSAYMTIIGAGPGPSQNGIVVLDEMEKPKTYAKTAKRPKLGKGIVVGQSGEERHILVCEGEMEGCIFFADGSSMEANPRYAQFLDYVEAWSGEGPMEPIGCPQCGVDLEVADLERDYCQGCGTRRAAGVELSGAAKAFEEFSKGLLIGLIDQELLEVEEPALLMPLIAALSEYMGEKGHKWKSPDKAAASIAGWLLHRDEVAELHGSNSDVARVFHAVGRS